MKKLGVILLLVASAGLWAQDQPSAGQNQPSFSSNVAERVEKPSYSDYYCAGFVTKENIPTSHYVVAGLDSPSDTKFAGRGQVVYVTGGGYAVGNRYTVLRRMKDANLQEMFRGEHAMLKRAGNMYAELAHIVITNVDKDSAVAKIEFSCNAMSPGDFLIPFQEKPEVKFQARTTEFPRFAPYSGTAGRIVGANESAKVMGVGSKIYVNIGTTKGLKPGDYLRVTRNYDPKEMSPVDEITSAPPYQEDNSDHPAKVSKSDLKKLPYRGLGEAIVLTVTPETATCMITLALESIEVGDVVEVPAKR